jgi:dihydrofolate reductase
MDTDTESVPGCLDLRLIAAVAENGVIGKDGDMPWHYPRDLKHFRETTMGSPVIMGRATYESILDQMGRPLDGRANIVMSSTLDERSEPHVVVVRSLKHAMKQADAVAADGIAYVIGGADVYEQTLPVASQMILTEIPETPPGDTKFPDWNPRQWTEVASRSDGEITIVRYERHEENR